MQRPTNPGALRIATLVFATATAACAVDSATKSDQEAPHGPARTAPDGRTALEEPALAPEELEAPVVAAEQGDGTLAPRSEPAAEEAAAAPPTSGKAEQARAADRKRRAKRGSTRSSGGMPAGGTIGALARPQPSAGWNGGVASQPQGSEAYDRIEENDFVAVADDPRSTFSIDVDTASYSNVRRFLEEGRLPPPDAVRIEELVNYFAYDYDAPIGADPFSMTSEVSEAPWNENSRLVHIGLQGKMIDQSEVPARNLVFLFDVSGSMNAPDKLPLLERAMALLADNLRPADRVSIVVYAGASGMVLAPTPGSRKAEIMGALDRLAAGGSTNGGAGIELAYRLAEKTFIEGGINRVVLATDGDFNVGTTSRGDLVRLIENKRQSGVFLSVLGFGTGNIKDATMEQLADKGNGNYAYIDSIGEARKVLVEEAGATLVTIAKDVKIQVEFNPAEVASYRLIGYENRKLAHSDFNDDSKDAGEIGAGHSVTALYEIVPPGASGSTSSVDALKYQDAPTPSSAAASGELLTVKVRYKQPDGDESKLLRFAVTGDDRSLETTSRDYRFAAAVAELGMLLRDSEHKADASYEQVLTLARDAIGKDPHGHRRGFLELVKKARHLHDGRGGALAHAD